MKYKIVRHYLDKPGKKRTIARGLALREAREHCRSPETASFTATSPEAQSVTLRAGRWFDHYERDTDSRVGSAR